MTSIPEAPRDQLLFFIDNPIVAAEPGGHAIIKGFTELLDALLGDGGSSARASLFGDELFASAPIAGEPADGGGHGGNGGGHQDGDAGAAMGLVLGLLGGLAQDLDI